MRLTKLAVLLALAFPAFAQFGSNATHLRGKPLCNPFAPTDAQVLTYSSSTGCWAGSAAGAGLSAIADQRILGNVSGGSAVPIGITTAQVAAFLGVLPAGNMPAFTGDVTNSAGAVAMTIAASAVTNSKIANATIDLTSKVTGLLPTANNAMAGSAVFSDTDALCAVTGGTCPAGSVVATANTEAGFAHNVALAQNVPATNKAVRVTYGFWTSVQGGPPPTVTFTLRACLTANFTTGAAVACSSGGVILWQLATTANGLGDVSGSSVSDGAFTFIVQGGGSGILYVTNTARSGGAFMDALGRIFTTMTTNPKTSTVPMTAGAWTLYMTAKFSAATTSNWIQQINGPIVETIN